MVYYKNQILATLAISLICVSHGIVAAWKFPNFLMLSSTNSQFSIFSILRENDTVLHSFLCIGSIILGCILTGIVTHFCGRKIIICSMGVPHVLYWLLNLYVDNEESEYVQCVLAALTTGCAFITVTATITEFCDREVRGNLGTFFSTGQNLGFLIGSITGNYLGELSFIKYIFIGVPILFMVCMIPFPETPQQLLRKGREDKAKESLRFYKNLKKTSSDIELLNNLLDEMKTNIIVTGQDGKISSADFCSKEFVCRFCQAVLILSFYLCNGSYVVINVVSNYCLNLYSTPEIGTIILCAIHLFASIAANMFSHLYSRKYCLVFSSFLGGLFLSSVGILSVYYERIHSKWGFIILVNFATISLQIGINSLSHLIVAELMPLKVKNITIAIVYGVSALIGLAFTKIYPSLLLNSQAGVLAALFICGSSCFIAVCFYLCGLYETSQKYIG